MSPRRLETMGCLALALAVGASGTWLVTIKMQARLLFAELEELNREQDRLDIDWNRLRIEQAAYASNPRVEQLARENLALASPSPHQVVVVVEPRR